MTGTTNNRNNLTTTTGESKAVVAIGNRGLVLTDLESLWRFAQYVAASGFAPKGMERPEAIFVAVQMGLELGLSPMAALQNIAVINGRPGVFGDAAKALVDDSGLCVAYTEHPGRWCDECEREGDDTKKCPECGADLKGKDFYGYIVTSHRRGREHPITSGFNVGQAKKAGLWGKKGPWTEYPQRMLKFRARGFNLRDNFPDVLRGFRTTEELQDIPQRMLVGGPDRRPVRVESVEPEAGLLPDPMPEPFPAAPKPTNGTRTEEAAPERQAGDDDEG